MVTAYKPGTVVERRALRAAPGFPTDTGQAFFVGFTEKGPTTPVKITSELEYETTFGGRSGVYATMADSVETFFGEGGAAVWIGRVVGPTPVAASVTLADASDDTITVTARSVGTWANGAAGGLDVIVAAGTSSGKKITITLNDVAVEEVDNLATVAAIIAAFAESDYVVLTDEASGTGDPLPTNGTFPLTGGTDDNGNATDTQWAAALAGFLYTYGPGQVCAPGRTSTVGHTQLLEHAAEFNRTALLDGTYGASATTLKTAAAAVEDLDDAERGGLFSTWLQIPAAVAGVPRYVPPSAVVAGLCATNDAVRNPGVQPIAEQGRLRYAIAATDTFTDAARDDLYDNGVNVFLDDPLGLRLYGFRSVTTEDSWRDLSANRLFMELEARTKAQDEFFVGAKITNAQIAEYNSAATSIALEIYDRDSLYGDSPDEAFRVNTDPPINTRATAAAREINREVYLRVAESAELVRTITTKVPVTSTV